MHREAGPGEPGHPVAVGFELLGARRTGDLGGRRALGTDPAITEVEPRTGEDLCSARVHDPGCDHRRVVDGQLGPDRSDQRAVDHGVRVEQQKPVAAEPERLRNPGVAARPEAPVVGHREHRPAAVATEGRDGLLFGECREVVDHDDLHVDADGCGFALRQSLRGPGHQLMRAIVDKHHPDRP